MLRGFSEEINASLSQMGFVFWAGVREDEAEVQVSVQVVKAGRGPLVAVPTAA